MADYFTSFSLIFSLPSVEAQAYALQLAEQASQIQQGDEPPANFPEDLKSAAEDWCLESNAETDDNKPALWLHSSNGGIDAVCSFVQHLLQKFDPQGRVTFEWSHDCSKPRTDAYGGGAAVITARKIKTFSTSEWLSQQEAAASSPREHVFSSETQCCQQCGRHSDDDAVEPQPCQTPEAP